MQTKALGCPATISDCISVLCARIATLDTALDSADPGLFGNVSFVAIQARAAEQHQIFAAKSLEKDVRRENGVSEADISST